MGSFVLLRSLLKEKQMIGLFLRSYRPIEWYLKIQNLVFTNCIQHLYLSYFRSFAAIYTYTYIYMNRCVGIIFNAIYQPESCKMIMQYALNH